MRPWALALCVMVSAGPELASGAGTILVGGSGVALRWPAAPVPYRPDRGRLGKLDNAAATAFVASTFAVWEAVPSAAISFASAGQLPVDVKKSNYASYLSRCDGVSPIVFDDDGSITDDLLGIGARNVVLGFASPECGDSVAGTITEAIAVLNGRFIDGVESSANPEMPIDDFGAVFLHEFGHFFNLDHSQVNLREAFDDDPTNDDAVATMFPFLVNGAEAGSLALDDVASVSALYPAAGFAETTGTIRGRIARADGTGFQGAYVVARSLADPRRITVGVTSGARFAPDAPGGPAPEGLRGAYEIPGLPAGSYTVEIEQIDPRFTGGSSVGPLDPPAVLSGPPERWNGPNEAATSPPDDPDAFQVIEVGAGSTAEAIDIVLNEPVAPNDACEAAIPVIGIPFTDTEPASAATTVPGDPFQSCTAEGPSKNLASVWYVLTAPVTGRFVVETWQSDYDTVLSAWSGSCTDLHELACNDDGAAIVQSRLDLDLAAGTTVLVEATAYRDTTPRTLRIAFRFGCAAGVTACGDGDVCTSGDTCADGICQGPTATCDDGNACTADVCSPTGACSHEASLAACDDGDVCTVGDACVAAACRSGARVDAAGLAASLDGLLPIACGVERPRVRRVLGHRLARAGSQVARGAATSGAPQARAFERVRRLLRGVGRMARRLGRRGAVCGDLVAVRVATARAQLECVASDAVGSRP